MCELIGIFLLNLLRRLYSIKNIVLYRDDGLSIFKNCSGPQMGKIKKRLQKVFKDILKAFNDFKKKQKVYEVMFFDK